MKFTIECEMKDRWVPYFLSMLNYMQLLGNMGCSRLLRFYSDGDGDFRPIFKWNESLEVKDKNFESIKIKEGTYKGCISTDKLDKALSHNFDAG